MALAKNIFEVIKTKNIYNYGKRSFCTVLKEFSEIKHGEGASMETHFGFETVKETEKAEKGMTGHILMTRIIF